MGLEATPLPIRTRPVALPSLTRAVSPIECLHYHRTTGLPGGLERILRDHAQKHGHPGMRLPDYYRPTTGERVTLPRIPAIPRNRVQPLAKGVCEARIAFADRRSHGFPPVTPSRFGSKNSQVRILSPRLFFETSPSARTSKGFLVSGMGVAASRSCSNGAARGSAVPAQ